MYSSLQYRSGLTEEPTVTLGPQLGPTRTNPNEGREQRRGGPGEEEPLELRNRYVQELEICRFEIESLKEHVEVQEGEKEELEQIIAGLKKELSAASRENGKLFQDNERHRQLVEKLKIDNKSMEMEIDKFRAERKVYYSNLNNIEALKRDIAEKMADKSSTLEEVASKHRKLERTHLECSLRIEELERSLRDAQTENKDLKAEVKSSVEKFLSASNNAVRLEYELKLAGEKARALTDKLHELEQEREEIRVRFGTSRNENSLSESNNSGGFQLQKSMVEIQSYIREVSSVLDTKREDFAHSAKNYDKLKISLECLEKQLK